jgi:hypothetical protein
MPEANATQVGGTHYQADVQHWDLVTDNGIGYLEGCASKYVTRARKKHGRQDLTKALHYIDKIIEKGQKGIVRPPFFMRWVMRFMEAFKHEVPVSVTPPVDFGAFAKANGLTARESLCVRLICDWKHGADLLDAKKIIQAIIDDLDAAAAAADVAAKQPL